MTRDVPIGAPTKVHIASDVYARRFGEEMVLLDFARGEYFGLDEVGAYAWERLSDGMSLSAVAAAIVERYTVDLDAALRDVCDLVRELCAQGLVTVTP